MNHEKPLWWRIHFDAVYADVCRAVGYKGMVYRDFAKVIEDLAQKHDKRSVESAVFHLVTYDGQLSYDPKPLSEVKLQGQVQKLCFQLLGLSPGHPEYERLYGELPKPQPESKKRTKKRKAS